MSSQGPPAISSKASASNSKASAASSQTSPAPSIAQQYFSNEARRSGSSGGAGSGNSAATPRSNQGAKPKHKPAKRFRMVDDDADAEQFSMQNPSGRRGQQSITHLMQFALPPRPQQQQYGRYGGGRPARRNPTWGLGSGYHAVDKARYIHANYRFIVDPRGDYHPQTVDADVHLDWSNVLQIIASAKTQSSSCPICLGEPTAPRMAKCGHIFCMPCLIRYMHAEDGSAPSNEKKARWKKCPICWDSIYISETRPVRFYTGQENDTPQEGGDIVLRLVKRKPDSTLAMPRESADTVAKGEDIPWYFAAEVMDYARVMKGSEEYMVQQYDEALAAIEQMEKEDELMFGEDAEWTGRATRMLREAKDKIHGIGNPPEQPKKPEQIAATPERPPIQFNSSEEGVPEMYLHKHQDASANASGTESSTADNASTSDTSASTHSYVVPRTLHEMRQRHLEKPQPSEYLYYHALQHYYLSSLDIRILKAAFGSYSSFPSSILPRVERVSSGHVVDDELRKRVKYLAHLPYGCEVGFLECDWTDTVSPEVLKEFQVQIERRRKRNEEKEAREEKERIRIEKVGEAEYAAIRRTTKRTNIPDEFFSAGQLPNITESMTDGALPVDGMNSSSPPWPNRTTSSFASLASPSTSPSAHRTVWGTAAIAPSSPDALPSDAAFAQEGDGWLQDWERDILADNELAMQMEGLGVQDSSKQSGRGGGGGKKGKKGKKVTLMSTTNRRGA